MFKNTRHIVLGILTISLLSFPGLVAVASAATPPTAPAQGSSANAAAACEGLEATGASCDATSANNTVNSTIKLVINVLSLIVGLAAVVMIIIGGLKYITSGGEAANITSAKNTILYAIIGLIIVALAQVIVAFVIKRAVTPVCKPTQSLVNGVCQ